MKKNSFFLLLLMLWGASVQATPGVSSAQFSSVMLESNGFITAAGAVNYHNNTNFLLARFNPFGAIDTDYGNYGYVIRSIGQRSGAQSLAISNNKMIVVGGAQFGQLQEFAIACYNNDGTVGRSFNCNGLVARSIGAGAILNSAAIDSAGNYVGAGIAIVDGAPLTIVARYNPDGSYDEGFGLTGIAMKRIFGSAGAYDLALQSSGKIVTAGFAITPTGARQFALIRFNNDGSIDTTLGSVGTIVTSIGADSCAYAVLSLANNYIVCAGVSNNQCAVARYTSTGNLDINFGVNGIINTAIGNTSQINDIALQANGNLVAVGYSDSQFALMRYTPQGVLDTAFGKSGIVTTQIGLSGSAQAVAIQPDGKIVVAGFCNEGAVIARYLPNGRLDPVFGNNGIVIFPLANDAPDIMGITNVNIADDAAIAYDKLNLATSITNGDISATAAITDSKLQTIITPGKIDNRATSATQFNVPNGIVTRDTLGNFSANFITATLVGNVEGAASQNLLKSGDTMSGPLIVQPGSPQLPSFQFADNDDTGFSAQQNSISITTNGAQAVLIDGNGAVTINQPLMGAALTITNGGAVIGGDISNSGNIIFDAQSNPLNVVGTTLGAGLKIFTGTYNTGLSGSVTIDYSSAGFINIPVICANAINGIPATLSINNVNNSSAVISSSAGLNVPFNYIVIGQ